MKLATSFSFHDPNDIIEKYFWFKAKELQNCLSTTYLFSFTPSNKCLMPVWLSTNKYTVTVALILID